MIKCNLAVLLAERGLKMSDIINETKLAKNTIRSLYYNEAKGIQFSTLETICDYLSVDIDEFLEKTQFSITIDDVYKIDDRLYKMSLSIHTEKEEFVEEIEIEEEYPTRADHEDEMCYSFKIPRKTFNTIRTLPETKRLNFTEKFIIREFFNAIGLPFEDINFKVMIHQVNTDKLQQWFGQETL